jgi:hypothetical protein
LAAPDGVGFHGVHRPHLEEAVNPALLHIEPLAFVGKNRRPLFIEVPVPQESGPYLSSTSSAVAWVERPFPKTGSVRAALRQAAPTALFAEVVHATMQASEENEWGCVVKTIAEAESRLAEYDFTDYDVLDRENAPWLPEGVTHVFVPTDRKYLGTAFVCEGDWAAVVVHNASRGMSVVQP